MALLASAGAEEEDEAEGISWSMRKHARLVRDSCFAHILPPAGLGARHASAAHKAHAWLHQHRLESKDWSSTQKLIELYVSTAVDSGPEAKLSRVVTTPQCNVSLVGR